MIPSGWCKLLAAFYNQKFRTVGPNSKGSANNVRLDIPSPVITVQYSDMQGVSYTQEIKIPWTGSYRYMKTSESEDAELKSMDLRTGFYESYIR